MDIAVLDTGLTNQWWVRYGMVLVPYSGCGGSNRSANGVMEVRLNIMTIKYESMYEMKNIFIVDDGRRKKDRPLLK